MYRESALIGQLNQSGICCWAEQSWLVNGFLHGFTGVSPFDRQDTKDKIANILGIDCCLELEQIHSSEIIDIDELGVEEVEKRFQAGSLKADAFIFNLEQKKKFMAFIKTADCVPIIIKGTRRCAVVHAGWRGLASGIVEKATELVIKKCSNRKIEAVIGPCICEKCYEVGDDVASNFQNSCLKKKETGKYLLNLALAAELAIKSVRQDALVMTSSICTKENTNFYSYREDPKITMRNFTFVCS